MREAFFGIHYFDQFQSNLGIATNILASRLKSLVEHEILKKQKDPDDARRIKYKLTEKGIDLYPVTLALMRWGDRWLFADKGPPLMLRHEKCGHRLIPAMCCTHCGEIVDVHEVSFEERFKLKDSLT